MLHSAGCVPPARGHCWPCSGRSCTVSSVSLSPWPPPQVPSGPAPAPCMPYLKEGHVLAIVLFSFLQVCAVDEGTALLGIAIACRIGSRGVNWWPPALNSPQRSHPPPQSHRALTVWAHQSTSAVPAPGRVTGVDPGGTGQPGIPQQLTAPIPHTPRRVGTHLALRAVPQRYPKPAEPAAPPGWGCRAA